MYGVDLHSGYAVRLDEPWMLEKLLPMTAWVAGLTFWRLQHPGVQPMLSRHCRGLRELARDRRRYPRPVALT